jgi:hypothetical protein
VSRRRAASAVEVRLRNLWIILERQAGWGEGWKDVAIGGRQTIMKTNRYYCDVTALPVEVCVVSWKSPNTATAAIIIPFHTNSNLVYSLLPFPLLNYRRGFFA